MFRRLSRWMHATVHLVYTILFLRLRKCSCGLGYIQLIHVMQAYSLSENLYTLLELDWTSFSTSNYLSEQTFLQLARVDDVQINVVVAMIYQLRFTFY